jgi:hypothetical protein
MLRRVHCPKELTWVLFDAVGDNERSVFKAEKQGLHPGSDSPARSSTSSA